MSVLRKTIPVLQGAGKSVIEDFMPLCKPTPLQLILLLMVF
jgi:hypothetical protein